MHWIGICVLWFIIGRAVQRWCDNAPDLERAIYEAGYRAGLQENDPGYYGGYAEVIDAPTDV